MGAGTPGVNDDATGVVAAEIGGVELIENGEAIGERRVDPGMTPGLTGLGVAREFVDRPNGNPELG